MLHLPKTQTTQTLPANTHAQTPLISSLALIILLLFSALDYAKAGMTETKKGDAILHPAFDTSSDMSEYEFWSYYTIGYDTALIAPLPKSIFWTANIRKIPKNAPRPYLVMNLFKEDPNVEVSISERDTGEGQIENTYSTDYTHFRDYSGRFKVNGNLRISQSLNLKHKAPIDIMMFFDKPSAKAMDTTNVLLTSPYKDDIYNHRIVKEILGDERFERFMSKRFNYESIPISAEIGDVDNTLNLKEPILALRVDYGFNFFVDGCRYNDEIAFENAGFPIFKLFDFSIAKTPYEIAESREVVSSGLYPGYDSERAMVHEIISLAYPPLGDTAYKFATPMVKGVFANTRTKENDFYVNVRDKPSKDGKIIMQLYLQILMLKYKKISYNLHKRNEDSQDYEEWERKQAASQREHFEKHKDKDIKKLYGLFGYDIFVWDVLEGDWAKVWVLTPEGDYNGEYIDAFLNNPSKLIIKEGYIHTSGLVPDGTFPKPIKKPRDDEQND